MTNPFLDLNTVDNPFLDVGIPSPTASEALNLKEGVPQNSIMQTQGGNFLEQAFDNISRGQYAVATPVVDIDSGKVPLSDVLAMDTNALRQIQQSSIE